MRRVIIILYILIASATQVFAQLGESRVVEYYPAPGQFINTTPQYESGDDRAKIIEKANSAIDMGTFITLGGWGGYVTVKLDNAIVNSTDGYNFSVLGNAFKNSSEPGIVMVSKDENKNGLPDDRWYEIAGSEYDRSIKDYALTYYRPTTESKEALNNYILWIDNKGVSGYISKGDINQQSYYPLWEGRDSLHFRGTLLPNNSVDVNGNGNLFQLKSFAWGYADNHSNREIDSISFKLSWAVDSLGNAVNIDKVHFVRVYTGINKVNGKIGECSTEFAGIKNLTPEIGSCIANGEDENNIICFYKDGWLTINANGAHDYAIYSTTGLLIKNGKSESSETIIDMNGMQDGIYLIRCHEKTMKIIKN